MFTLEDVPEALHTGDFCLFQPGDLVSLKGIKKTVTPFAHLDIFFNPAREEGFPTRPGQTDLSPYQHLIQPRLNDINGVHIPFRLRPPDPEGMQRTLLHMISAWQENSFLSLLGAQALATQVVIMILENYSEHKAQEPRGKRLHWIPSYLSLNISEKITVKDLAARAHLSESQFARAFKEQFGKPPYQYLMQMRVQYACDLLRNSNVPIERVAEHCGFSNVQHFTKAFKQITGRSPGEYRHR